MASATAKQSSERASDAARKRAQRAADRDLTIPAVVNPGRKRRCERNTPLWLKTYLPAMFPDDWTADQLELIRATEDALTYGNDDAKAAPRGIGKTTIFEGVAIKCMLTGVLRFPLIVAATGPDATMILDHIKEALETSDPLYKDYPEVCHPIRDLRGAPNRAGAQTVGGRLTRMRWGGPYLRLPAVYVRGKASRASGAVISTRGMDAAIRGVRVGTLRPDAIFIDDPETRESVKSEEQTKQRRLIIEEDLAGCGAPGKSTPRIMRTTIMRRCTKEGNPTISFQYTNPTDKPNWGGRRYKLLETWPDRTDLWDEYQSLREEDFNNGDKYARKAHRFYIDNRKAMDAGAVVNAPGRFNGDPAPDGSPMEVSALQHCMNIIGDRGEDAFKTEYNNDPPEDSGPIESGITSKRIQCQVSGYGRRQIPPECVLTTRAIDVGKQSLHWVARAWREDGTGFTVAYDVHNVKGTIYGSDEGLDIAIRNALLELVEGWRNEPYLAADGELLDDLIFVDAGYRTDAVYLACSEIGLGIRPAMGFGKSAGCARANFSDVSRRTRDRKPGDGWFESKKRAPSGGAVWLVCMDADRWKAYEHDRWMTTPGNPGCLFLWGDPSDNPRRLSLDQKAHMAYSKHLTSEIEIEETVSGVLQRRWKAMRDSNHFFDASYMTCVAAAMKGVRVMAGGAKPRRAERREAMTLAEMAASAGS